MVQWYLSVDVIGVPPADAMLGQVPAGHQLVDDAMHRWFRDPHLVSDVAHPSFGISSYRQQHLGGDHLADALPKLRALADYAERHGGRYARIESVAKGSDGCVRKLSLHEASVRDTVRGFAGPRVTPLYDDAQVAKPYL